MAEFPQAVSGDTTPSANWVCPMAKAGLTHRLPIYNPTACCGNSFVCVPPYDFPQGTPFILFRSQLLNYRQNLKRSVRVPGETGTDLTLKKTSRWPRTHEKMLCATYHQGHVGANARVILFNEILHSPRSKRLAKTCKTLSEPSFAWIVCIIPRTCALPR